MSDQTVARRYAQALYAEADAQGTTARTDADVALVAETLAGSRELRRAFASPDVARAKKEAVLDGVFGERTAPLTMRFLNLILSKGREEDLETVLKAYQNLRDEQQGTVEVSVRTAKPLTAADEKALQKRLETLTGNSVRLAVTVDAELVGGLVVRVGDTVYDGSVRNQLAALREKLEHGRYTFGTDAATPAAADDPPRATAS